MKRILVVLTILCATIGISEGQEEPHLPEYLVFMKQFTVHIQVREPSGIEVWTRDSAAIEMFGIELHVGRQNSSHHEPVWDRRLEANISTTVDGKFMIVDPDMTISKGEIIRYRFSVLHKGTLSHSNYRRLPVTDHLFYHPKNYDCYSQCLVGDKEAIRLETARLKAILETKILDCVGTRATEFLFFPLANATSLVADPQWFVEYRLWQIDSLRPLLIRVGSTYLSQDGVGVRMKTVLDKLIVLELGKGKLDIQDFDPLLDAPIESVTETDDYVTNS